ncbi:MAG: sigma-70 family RNA polymerase sigma factor, partial [Burkholderiales bacterium]
RGKPLTWMLVICRSRALDYLRQNDRAKLCGDADELAETKAADVVDLLAVLERDSAIHGALAKLAPIQRQLIALAFFRGLTQQEIATASRIPLGTVKSHIRKALEAMRKPLAQIHD